MERHQKNAVAIVRRSVEGSALEELEDAARFILDDVGRAIRQ